METIIQIQHLQKHFGNLKVLNDVDSIFIKEKWLRLLGQVDLVKVRC